MINFPFLLCNRRMQYFLFPQTVIRYGSCDECFTVLSAHALALYPHSSLECQPHSLPIHFYSLLAMAGRLFSVFSALGLGMDYSLDVSWGKQWLTIYIPRVTSSIFLLSSHQATIILILAHIII